MCDALMAPTRVVSMVTRRTRRRITELWIQSRRLVASRMRVRRRRNKCGTTIACTMKELFTDK